jgi:large subunit ribosomal protein L1
MAKTSKRYTALQNKIGAKNKYSTVDAFDTLITLSSSELKAKFDESVDVAVRLGVNPKYADQQVRGACPLPNGTGKGVRVLVFAEGEAGRLATEAGADFVGGQDLIDQIKGGWTDFDKAVSTRGMMPKVARFLGRILGPRGLMPNPKIGTVVDDAQVGEAVSSLRKGKIDFRVDKNGIIHTSIGRVSMESEKLQENFLTLLSALVRLKPASSKGSYVRSITLSTTMGPGIKIDTIEAQRQAERF